MGQAGFKPLKEMPLSYKKHLIQTNSHLQKSKKWELAIDRDKARLRELAQVSGRLVEFSVAWARRLKSLKPETVQRLKSGLDKKGLPLMREQTRQVGGQLGEGLDFRTYESFTPQRGHTVTKVLKEQMGDPPLPLKWPTPPAVVSALDRTKKAWAAVAASPAGAHAALPVSWHKAGYVQDRMVRVRPGKAINQDFFDKITPFPKVDLIAKYGADGIRLLKESGGRKAWYKVPKGAIDSELYSDAQPWLGRKVSVQAHNIMFDPRRGKRKLVLTDPLGQVSR